MREWQQGLPPLPLLQRCRWDGLESHVVMSCATNRYRNHLTTSDKDVCADPKLGYRKGGSRYPSINQEEGQA